MEYLFEFQRVPFDERDFVTYVHLITQLDHSRVVSRASVEALILSDADHVLVARLSEGVIAGTARLHIQLEPEGSSARLEDVVVDEAHRRKGIAHTMIQRLDEHAVILGVLWCELTSKPFRVAAHELYRAHGYTEVDTHVFVKEYGDQGNEAR